MSQDSQTVDFEQSPARNKNRYSIDLSLELEHQLELESPLPTPARPQEQHEQQQQQQQHQMHHQQRPSFQLPDIDPHVLAHIISQLRHQLADMTRERDDLVHLLNTAHTKQAELQDALQHITDKAMGLDDALSESKKKNRDDEEAISMLRTKVEESRRGLMRLQAESRRQGPASLDVGRANAPSAFMGPPSSKRASFTPLTGTFAANSFGGRPNGHRRISSVSDSGLALNIPDVASSDPNLTAAPAPNRRLSAFFGRSSPPREPPLQLSRSASDSSPSPDELEKLRKELRTVQAVLDETRHELSEANEAREASETCVGALREFIAENNLGSSAVKLPPLPSTTTGDEMDNAQKKGWGFKLWKVDTSVKGAPGPASDVTASPILPATNANSPPAPLARKLTGFFGSRASVSSVASSLTPLQTAVPPRHRDSVYSLSDASSLAEPISPTSQGGNGADAGVRVRDVNGSPDLSPDAVHAKEAPQPQIPHPGDDALSL